MADDPNRDLLPVKEGAPYERKVPSACPTVCERDTYTPYITKLDRKSLEDRYMSLLLDNNLLKKESHKQEDKIKRLATKLLRLIAEQKRDMPTAQRRDYNMEVVITEQEQQIRELEQNNCHLQNRITVLKNQLAEHSSLHSASYCSSVKPRSSSRSPGRRSRPSSSRTQAGVSSPEQNMFQGQNSPICMPVQVPTSPKINMPSCSCHSNIQRLSEVPVDNPTIQQNQQLTQEVMRLHEQIRILEQALESQREETAMRIAELEEEVENRLANDKKQKVAENVEVIRLQRSLQQQSAQMAAQTAKIQVLERERLQLRKELEVSQKDNEELQHQVVDERQKLVDIKKDLQGVETDSLSVRELQEQIRDLQHERIALKKHNEQLLILMSSKEDHGSSKDALLHSKVAQLESMLKNEQCECGRLNEELQKLKTLQSDYARNQEKLSELEAALAAEKNERSATQKLLNEMQKKKSESASEEMNLKAHVISLEATLNKLLGERQNIEECLKEEKKQVEMLQRSHSELVRKIEELKSLSNKKNDEPTRTSSNQNKRCSSDGSVSIVCGCGTTEQERLRIPSLKQTENALRDKRKANNFSHNNPSATDNSVSDISSSGASVENKSEDNSENSIQISKEEISEEIMEDILNKDDSESVWKKEIVGEIMESILNKAADTKESLEIKDHPLTAITQPLSTIEEESSCNVSTENSTLPSTKMSSAEGPDSSDDFKSGKESSSDNILFVPSTEKKTAGTLHSNGEQQISSSEKKWIDSKRNVSNFQQRLFTDRTSGTLIKRILPSSYYTQLSSLLLASVTEVTSRGCILSSMMHQRLPSGSSNGTTSEAVEEESSQSLVTKGSQERQFNLPTKYGTVEDDTSYSEAGNSISALPDDSSKTTTADKIDICRELEKCRELLRVQYNLNSLYKKEVASLAKQLCKKGVKVCTNNPNEVIPKTKTVGRPSPKLSGQKFPPKSAETCNHLTVQPGEGIFEIHIQRLEIYPGDIIQLCESSNPDDHSLFVTWVFYDQDVAYTPVKKLENKIEFDSSSVCRITLNNEFLQYLAEKTCTVEVHMTVEDASETVARGSLSFFELLQFPQNKIHTSVLLTGTKENSTLGNFGVIQCWYRLSCSVQIINDFVQKNKIEPFKIKKVKGTKVKETKLKEKPIPAPRAAIPVSVSEPVKVSAEPVVEEITESVDETVDESIEAPSQVEESVEEPIAPSSEVEETMSKSSEINLKRQMETDPTTSTEIIGAPNIEQESSEQLLLPAGEMDFGSATSAVERAGPSGYTSEGESIPEVIEDYSDSETIAESIPEEINDHSINNQSTAATYNEKYDTTSSYVDDEDTDENTENHIAVTVGALFLQEGTALMNDPDVTTFFIRYEFLGYGGPEMNTPISLPKPDIRPYVLMFKFRKVYYLDHKHQLLLQDLLQRGGEVRFSVFTEPLEDETGTKDVEEVGYGILNLQEVLHKAKSDVFKEVLTVKSSFIEENIGLLSVILEGLTCLRKRLPSGSSNGTSEAVEEESSHSLVTKGSQERQFNFPTKYGTVEDDTSYSEAGNSISALPDDSSKTTTADKIDICRELEKCRELLHVQYNLNSLYKKEAELQSRGRRYNILDLIKCARTRNYPNLRLPRKSTQEESSNQLLTCKWGH